MMMMMIIMMMMRENDQFTITNIVKHHHHHKRVTWIASILSSITSLSNDAIDCLSADAAAALDDCKSRRHCNICELR